MERVVRERMTTQDVEAITPQTLINIRPVVAAIKEFFGTSQLSQFMDQVNPLSGLTHRRRLSALGPGGLSRERAGFDGPRPRPGSGGLAHALETFRANRNQLHRSDPRHLIDDTELDAAAGLIGRLSAALAPLEALKAGDHPLSALAHCHREVIAALSPDALVGHDGKAQAQAFEELVLSPAAAGLAVSRGDYPELFHTTIAGRIVRRPEIADVQVRIFGPLEARLQNIDRVVLGGLNEGTWPPETRSDPWLSRPMRRALGLDPPERRIGLSAHDFAQALARLKSSCRARQSSPVRRP